MKKFLFVVPLFSFIIQSADAVKTASPEDDAITLETGRTAPAVCYLEVLLENGTSQGSGSLVEPDIIITAAHMFLEDIENQKVVPGIPGKAFGFVTFAANATQVIFSYGKATTLENLSPFYEMDSAIVHRDYKDRFADPDDIAFIKLKRPVEGIDPIPLYNKGTIPESKLKLHNQGLAITEESMSTEKLLIDGYGYGYGLDVFQNSGQRRGVYLPSFIGFEDPASSSSESSEDSAAERAEIANEGDVVSLTAYFPGPRVDNASAELDEEGHKFHDSLYELVKKKGELSGLIHKGDSGGPLLVSGKIVGVHSVSDEYGDLLSCVKDFSDVSKLYRVVDSYVAPLFSHKTGELRPEIPEMIKTLRSYPLSNESNLKDFVLNVAFNKTNLQLERAVSDLETLLLSDFTNEKLESIINKYSNPENNVSINFEKALNHFKNGEFEAFKEKIQEIIGKINVHLREREVS